MGAGGHSLALWQALQCELVALTDTNLAVQATFWPDHWDGTLTLLGSLVTVHATCSALRHAWTPLRCTYWAKGLTTRSIGSCTWKCNSRSKALADTLASSSLWAARFATSYYYPILLLTYDWIALHLQCLLAWSSRSPADAKRGRRDNPLFFFSEIYICSLYSRERLETRVPLTLALWWAPQCELVTLACIYLAGQATSSPDWLRLWYSECCLPTAVHASCSNNVSRRGTCDWLRLCVVRGHHPDRLTGRSASQHGCLSPAPGNTLLDQAELPFRGAHGLMDTLSFSRDSRGDCWCQQRLRSGKLGFPSGHSALHACLRVHNEWYDYVIYSTLATCGGLAVENVHCWHGYMFSCSCQQRLRSTTSLSLGLVLWQALHCEKIALTGTYTAGQATALPEDLTSANAFGRYARILAMLLTCGRILYLGLKCCKARLPHAAFILRVDATAPTVPACLDLEEPCSAGLPFTCLLLSLRAGWVQYVTETMYLRCTVNTM